MPICTIHLLALHVPLAQFLAALSRSPLTPLTISRVVRWIITPTTLAVDALLHQVPQWDLLLILPDAADLPASLRALIRHRWSVQAGVPSRLLQDFHSTNERLLRPRAGDVPPLTGALHAPRLRASAQDLDLSPELRAWIDTFAQQDNAGAGAVSMLNLLAFRAGRKDEYLRYGKAFAESIGSRRGGVAKLVGKVVEGGGADASGGGWDEFALAHYPSVRHFADMLASEDYQEVNHRYRVPALKDTCILCTTELGLPAVEQGAKL